MDGWRVEITIETRVEDEEGHKHAPLLPGTQVGTLEDEEMPERIRKGACDRSFVSVDGEARAYENKAHDPGTGA